MNIIKRLSVLFGFLLLSISCTFVNDIADDAVNFSQDENNGDGDGDGNNDELFTVALNASGVDSEVVTLSVQGEAFEIATDGGYTLVEDVASGTELTVTITYDGDDWACELSNVPATVTENTTADLNCAEQLWLQDAYLKAVNVESGEAFGRRVAIDGDFIVVSADLENGTVAGINNNDNHNETSNGPTTGAVYILTKGSDGHWYQDAYAKPTNLANGSHIYGASLSIHGDFIAVGDVQDSSTSTSIINVDNVADGGSGGTSNGAVYILKRDSTTGDWVQDAYLKADDNINDYEFGIASAMGDDILVVGASGHTGGGSNAGRVYTFERDSSTGDWGQTNSFSPVNSHTNQLFGAAIAMDGDTLVVGASGDENSISESGVINGTEPNAVGSPGVGAVYVYKFSSGSWVFDAFLRPQVPADNSEFGVSVAIHNGIIVVGAPGFGDSATGIENADNTDTNDDILANGGAVFVYREDSNGDWYQDAYINPSNGGSDDDFFGISVDIYNGMIVAGSQDDESNETGISNQPDGVGLTNDGLSYGSVFTFSVDLNGDWFQDAYLKNVEAGVDQSLGAAVAIDGDVIVAGMPDEDSGDTTINDDDDSSNDSSQAGAGAALVFEDRYDLNN